jgi:hypothetical protein
MNKPKYPQLRAHQELINTTGFMTKLHADSEARAALLALQTAEWCNVSLLRPDSKHPKLLVRVLVCGQQITVGQLPQKDYLNALRIADMALLFFWKYRKRGGALPTRFNFSLDQASRDMGEEPVHRGLLEDYENILISLKLLPSAEELSEQVALKAVGKGTNESIRDALEQLLDEQRQGFLTIRGELLGMNKHISQLEQQLTQLLTRLADMGTQQQEDMSRACREEESRYQETTQRFANLQNAINAIPDCADTFKRISDTIAGDEVS